MKRFKILLVAVSFLLFAIFAQELIFGSFGEFGDGTGSKDSVWMNVTTFDTLGYEANADSVWFWRFFRTTIIDSIALTGAGTRPGYYVTGKRAFDGTNYGQYNVKITWKVQGKYFTKPESYTVSDYVDSTDVGRWAWTTYGTKALTGIQTGVTIPTVTAVSNAVTITSNSDITNIKAKTDKLRFHTASPNDTDLVAYATNATGTAPTAYENALAIWHYPMDSTWGVTLAAYYLQQTSVMASLLGGKGNRMLDYYNASGKLDSVRYLNNATLVSRLIFYRPTATSAPDSMRMYSY